VKQTPTSWVVEVADGIANVRFVVASAAEWVTRRPELMRARYRAAARYGHSSAEKDLAIETGQKTTMSTDINTNLRTPEAVTAHPPVAPAPKPPVFDWQQWITITRSAIAESHKRADDARKLRADLDAEIAEHLARAKKLEKAIAVAVPDEKPRTERAAGPANRPTAKWGPIALEWGKAHDGEIILRDLASVQNVPTARFYDPMDSLIKAGTVQRVGPGHYRLVG